MSRLCNLNRNSVFSLTEQISCSFKLINLPAWIKKWVFFLICRPGFVLGSTENSDPTRLFDEEPTLSKYNLNNIPHDSNRMLEFLDENQSASKPVDDAPVPELDIMPEQVNRSLPSQKSDNDALSRSSKESISLNDPVSLPRLFAFFSVTNSNQIETFIENFEKIFYNKFSLVYRSKPLNSEYNAISAPCSSNFKPISPPLEFSDDHLILQKISHLAKNIFMLKYIHVMAYEKIFSILGVILIQIS